MVQPQAILDWSDRIAAEFQPERIILFGSYAYGAPNDDSDVDLLVVVEKGLDGWRKASEICSKVHPAFPVDVLVRTSAELRDRIAMDDFFLKEIVEKGIILHDANDARVGRRGRKRLQKRGPARNEVAIHEEMLARSAKRIAHRIETILM